MKTALLYVINLVLMLTLICSCSNRACENAYPYLSFEGFTAAEQNLIEVKEYEAGKSWQKVNRVFYTGTSVSVTSGTKDSVRVSDIPLATNSFYTFRFVQSNTVCSLYNMQYHPHRHRRLLIGGEVKACTNGFSYSVNGKNYSRAYEENLSYSTSKRGFVLRIPKE